MRRSLSVLFVLAVAVVLSAGISVSAASNKFANTSAVDSGGSFTVTFEEGGMKKYPSVDYRLDATAIARWLVSVDPPRSIEKMYPATSTVALVPDENGRTSGGLTLDISQSGGTGGVCECGLQHVEYFDMTLTNVTTGRVFRLNPISRDFP